MIDSTVLKQDSNWAKVILNVAVRVFIEADGAHTTFVDWQCTQIASGAFFRDDSFGSKHSI